MAVRKKVVLSSVAFIAGVSLAACSAEPKAESIQDKPAATTEEVHWSYQGDTGPDHWGELSDANAVCANGKEQSPINMDFSKIKKAEKGSLQVNYSPTVFSVANNGHTIQANAQIQNNKITIDGTEYKLVQFHFHTPSEHRFNGKAYDMELHLVHKDANNKLAVLGIMIKVGQKNEKLAALWSVLPKEKTTQDIALEQPIDLSTLLPQDQSTLRYNGSLTTPPCTEGIKWTMLEQPIEMSKEQIQAFQSIFPDNHRPVQPVNSREVTEN